MCDTLVTTRRGTDGDSLFVFRYSVGSKGHIHYPMGSTIPGDTQTVAKLPDEGSPIGTITPSMDGIIMGWYGVFVMIYSEEVSAKEGGETVETVALK